MNKQQYDSLSFQEQLDFNLEVSKYLDKCFESAKRDWLKNGNFHNMTITIKKNGEFYYGTEGPSNNQIRRGERKFAEAEITGRWKAAKNFYMRGQNYFRDDFSITLKPLICSYDFDINASGNIYRVEAKDRNYRSDSAIIKSGVMLEKLKVEESFRDNTWNDLIYTSTFSDGKQYSWKLSDLPNDTWIVHNMYCPDSTVQKKQDKFKPVYLLPLNYRCTELDIRISF